MMICRDKKSSQKKFVITVSPNSSPDMQSLHSVLRLHHLCSKDGVSSFEKLTVTQEALWVFFNGDNVFWAPLYLV